MDKHTELKKEQFSNSVEELYYNSGGHVMWSLFRFPEGTAVIFYHELDDQDSILAELANGHSLNELADMWDPVEHELIS